MPSTSTRRLAYAAWVAVCLLWGTTYLAIRIALETVPPMLMGGLRWTVAAILMLSVMVARRDRIPGRSEWPALTVIGLQMIAVGNGGVIWAEQTLPSGLTSVLVAVVPFWMVGIERMAGTTEPLTRTRTLGLVIGFAGIVLLVWPELHFDTGGGSLLAVLATQLACLGWALGSMYGRRRASAENVLAAAAFQMLFGGIAMLLVGWADGEVPRLVFDVRTGSAVAYLILFGSIVGYTAYAYALKHLPLATVSLYAYVNPVIAMVLGTIVLGEPMSARLAVAGAIVLAGIALVRR
jgi:drug/metabolite transporter (DMT)-like permease